MPKSAAGPITSLDDPRYLRALGHPVRVRALTILREAPNSPNGISKVLGQKLGVVAYHVRTLQDLGLIRMTHERPRRGATEHFYTAVDLPFAQPEGEWETLSPVAKQVIANGALEALAAYVSASAASGGFDGPNARLVRTRVRLDARGFKAVARAVDALVDRVERIEADAAKRIDTKGADAATIGLGFLLFESPALTRTGDGNASKRHADSSS